MNPIIQSIELVDLPNYMETIWSGGEPKQVLEAPLLAKFRAVVTCGDIQVTLIFEVREQPNGNPLIDEYYEDQIYDSLMRIIPPEIKSKDRIRRYNLLVQMVSEAVFDEWSGEATSYPKSLDLISSHKE